MKSSPRIGNPESGRGQRVRGEYSIIQGDVHRPLQEVRPLDRADVDELRVRVQAYIHVLGVAARAGPRNRKFLADGDFEARDGDLECAGCVVV